MIWIKGAGDLATGVAYRLHMSGFRLLLTELPAPVCVRRTVSFAEAAALGRHTVEGVVAVLCASPADVAAAHAHGEIPVLADPDGRLARSLWPAAAVDVIMSKRNTGTSLSDAPVVVGVGPGFTAGADCHAVVETQRGHRLGRVHYEGSAEPNTGIPGVVAGIGPDRVIRSPAAGVFTALRDIGAMVEPGDLLGEVFPEGGGSAVPVRANIGGVLRGLIRSGVRVTTGLKVGDVDPTCEEARCRTISDKALAVGGGVLEALLHFGVRPFGV